MKKILILGVVASLAMISQAASIAWNMNGMGLKDAEGNLGTLPAGGELVLVVMGAADGWDSATVIPTAASGSGTTTLVVNATTGRVTGKATFTYSADDTDSNLINNGDFLALMFKDSEGDLSKLVYTTGADAGKDVDASWEVSGLANNATSLTSKKIMATGNFAAVPEPTSGLLLLLGMAGLALRRKQA